MRTPFEYVISWDRTNIRLFVSRICDNETSMEWLIDGVQGYAIDHKDFPKTVVYCSYGPPSTVDDYLQQIGRAGRDGSQSHAILLYHGEQLRNLDSSMNKLLKSLEQCLRKILLEDFFGEQKTISCKRLVVVIVLKNAHVGHARELNDFEIFSSEDVSVEEETKVGSLSDGVKI